MSSFIEDKSFPRRDFLKGAGALVVAFSVPLELGAKVADAAGGGASTYPTVPLDQLDSFLSINADGSIVGSVGKINAGMGVDTALAQILAEELYVPFEAVTINLGDTATTPDQGGTGSSNGVITAGASLRNAGAQALQYLLGLAAKQLGVPVSQLSVSNGVISNGSRSNPQQVTYAQLVGGQRFNLKLASNVTTKPVSQYTIVGKSVQRPEIAKIATATHQYVADVRVPGMLHARAVRPPYAGATLVSVDTSQTLPGLVKVVSQGNFVAVVTTTEWEAVKAAKQLRVNWSKPATPPFPASYDALYAAMPSMPVRSSQVSADTGGVDKALSASAQTLQATYESAFQSHVSMGPACALADVKNGSATVWFGGQKPYRVRLAIADILKIPSANVRVIWAPGPGSYGTNVADDAAVEAAWISAQVGQPVRVQWTRADGIAWDPKAPAAVVSMKAGIDQSGRVSALDWVSWLFSGTQRNAGALVAGDALIGQLMGLQPQQTDSYGFAAANYGFPQQRLASHVLVWDQAIGTGLRTAHLRDPQGPQTQFAWESFMDEIAAAIRMDPVQFRLSYLDGYLDTEVIDAVARAANWESRPSPRLNGGHPIAKGRGIAYAPRGSSYVATVAEVEVNRNTGKVRVTRFVTAHQAGLIVNPNGIENTIEANLIQSMSRALFEAVEFNQDNVTSVDYKTYPVVDIMDVPDIEIVLLNHPELPASGAGEPSTRPTAAAIGNAIFDATGARVRRQPMTPEVVKAALKG